MRLSLHPGVYTSAFGLAAAGAGAVAVAPPWSPSWMIGWLSIAVGVSTFIWGIKINGRHWWARRSALIEEWMPLHEALYYLVYKSAWGAAHPSVADEKEFNRVVRREVQERLSRGEIAARGKLGWERESLDRGTEEIPSIFWTDSFFIPFGTIAAAQADGDAVCKKGGGGATYRAVILSRNDVRRVWLPCRNKGLTPLAKLVEGVRVKCAHGNAELETMRVAKRRRELIAKGRNVVHRFRESVDGEEFEAFASKDRDYLDVQPHLGEEYQVWRIKHAKTHFQTVGGGGRDVRAALFLRELARLEKEWGLV